LVCSTPRFSLWMWCCLRGAGHCKSAALLAESKMRLYFEARNYKVLGGQDRVDRLKD
jgi:hypothetical protein